MIERVGPGPPAAPAQPKTSFAVTCGVDGEVVFPVASFFRPLDSLARLAKPVARRIQRRVTLEYLASIEGEVQ